MSLPREIGNLIHLNYLDLGSNQFTVLPAEVIHLLNHVLTFFNVDNNPDLQGVGVAETFESPSFSGVLVVTGNQYIGFSGASWNGSFLPPTPAT